MPVLPRKPLSIAAVLAVLTLNGASYASPAPAPAESDRLETINRAVHDFNTEVERRVMAPLADGYRDAVPDEVKTGLANVFANLREPVTMLSSSLQGDFRNAEASAGRFLINSTLGLGGLHDKATEMGLRASRPEDFGQALCRYGAPQGSYLVLPLIGPTTPRDLAGEAMAFALGLSLVGEAYIPYRIADGLNHYFQSQEDLERFNDGAIDSYAAQKSAWLQQREAACREEPAPAPEFQSPPTE